MPQRRHRIHSKCREVALRSLNETLQRLSRRCGISRYYLLAQPVGLQPTTRQFNRLQVRELPSGDPALACLPRSTEEIERRFASRGVCIAAFSTDGERLLGAIWLLFAPYTENEHRCTLVPSTTPQCALDVDLYIFPQARGSTAFFELWQAADQLLLNRRYAWTLSRVSALNTPSLRAHRRLGAQRIGSLFFLRFGGYELLLSSQRPRLALTRPGRPPPTLHLRPP